MVKTAFSGVGLASLSGLYALHRRQGLVQETVASAATEDAVIRESVWVETDADTDGSGDPDRVHVRIVRPAATEADGTAYPVILRASPYLDLTPEWDDIGGSRIPPRDIGALRNSMEVELHEGEKSGERLFSRDSAPGTLDTVNTPGSMLEWSRYEEQLLPRRYVLAHATTIGSVYSTGCNQLGGPEEIESIRAVIDWFNGRGTAYTSRSGSEPVDAPWTNGRTGMIGGSYRGALATGVATTGVDGLQTIVPIRAVSNWYNYTRSHGAVITPRQRETSQPVNLGVLSGFVTTSAEGHRCDDTIADITKAVDPVTGNYNDFWNDRNYLASAHQIDASVLIVHGLNDQEVRMRHVSDLIKALNRNDVPHAVWLHRGGHEDPKERHSSAWFDYLIRWFDYWLKDRRNFVMIGPKATVEREDGRLQRVARWPHPRSEATRCHFAPDSAVMGDLRLEAFTDDTTSSFTDNSEISPREFLGVDHSEHRLLYRSPRLSESVHLSGTVVPRLTVSIDDPPALLSTALVAYEPDGTGTIISRGWMNPQNRLTLLQSDPVDPATPYELTFQLQAIDHIFEPASRIGLLIYSSDHDVTKRPPRSPELTLHLGESRVDLPVVGGEQALSQALPAGNPRSNPPNPSPTPTPTATPTPMSPEREAIPGPGIAGTIASLAGVGYLLDHLRRRRADDE